LLQQLIREELANSQAVKLIRDDLNLTLEADALTALVDGIGTGVVINPENFSAEQQQYLVQRHIKSLLTKS
jgi:BetI-type transcriptional repressor, C-terminal